MFQISEGIPNSGNKAAMDFEKDFRAKTGISVWYPRAVNEMRMFKAAAEKANSIDPVKVAAALEGMKFEVFDGGDGFMRKDDHQFFQDMYIRSFGPLEPDAKFDDENTGWGWKLEGTVKQADTNVPTTCKMERP